MSRQGQGTFSRVDAGVDIPYFVGRAHETQDLVTSSIKDSKDLLTLYQSTLAKDKVDFQNSLVGTASALKANVVKQSLVVVAKASDIEVRQINKAGHLATQVSVKVDSNTRLINTNKKIADAEAVRAKAVEHSFENRLATLLSGSLVFKGQFKDIASARIALPNPAHNWTVEIGPQSPPVGGSHLPDEYQMYFYTGTEWTELGAKTGRQVFDDSAIRLSISSEVARATQVEDEIKHDKVSKGNFTYDKTTRTLNIDVT